MTEITEKMVEISLRDLRRLAVRQRVRLVAGGLEAPNGGSCQICKGEWAYGEQERHAATCPIAAAFPEVKR
jgi:hypothetical protein